MRGRAGVLGWEEGGGDTRHALSEQVADHSEGVEVPLATRAEQRREHLLGLRAAPRAITARDFAIHDGRARRCSARQFVASIVGSYKKLKRAAHSRSRGAATRRTSGTVVGRSRAIGQARLQLAASHGHAVGGDRASRVAAIPYLRGLLQHRLDLGREGRAGMIGVQLATAAEQVGETGLMRGPIKLSIGGPAIAHEHARKVGPEERRRLVEAAARVNGIDGGVRRRAHPQPLQLRADPPPGFVGHDHRTLTDRLDQRRVGRRGLSGGAMEGVDHAPGRNRQPEVLLKDAGHLADGHTELLVQDRRGRHRARADLGGGRAERIGRLQGMPALDAAPTPLTLPDVDAKRAHGRPYRREIFVVLHRQPRFNHPTGTAGTHGRQRRFVGLIDVSGDGAVGRPPIRRAWLATGPARVRRAPILRERRSLPSGLARIDPLLLAKSDPPLKQNLEMWRGFRLRLNLEASRPARFLGNRLRSLSSNARVTKAGPWGARRQMLYLWIPYIKTTRSSRKLFLYLVFILSCRVFQIREFTVQAHSLRESETKVKSSWRGPNSKTFGA